VIVPFVEVKLKIITGSDLCKSRIEVQVVSQLRKESNQAATDARHGR
jgi:hypothetical protein